MNIENDNVKVKGTIENPLVLSETPSARQNRLMLRLLLICIDFILFSMCSIYNYKERTY